MLSIYERARDETGYVATRFLQMLSENGGLETAKRLINSPAPSDGFTTLWEKRRLDLSVEAHVMRPEFRDLFTSAELRAAEDRLRQYGYEAPAGHAP
jgi:hypothetical protein